MNNLTFADLFAGIGGFHQAFTQLNCKPVFASEWDKHARETYKANYYNQHPHLFDSGNFVGDITQVELSTIPDFNILTGGFPCQPFSNAGKRNGLDDTRGTLFFNIANILKEKQPEAFFLENVRGLLNHDNGKTFNIIKNTINTLGYSLHYKIVKASDHNLPQYRPRLFLIGFSSEVDDSNFSFAKPEPLTLTMSKLLGGNVTDVKGDEKKIGYTLRVGGRGSGLYDKRNWDSYLLNGREHRLTVEEGKKCKVFQKALFFQSAKRKLLNNWVTV